MSAWLISLEGTEAGHQLALVLALMAALLHAVFGAMQKGRHDPWISRGAVDLSYGLMAAPFALFVVPFPEPHMWPIFAIVWLIHVVYKLLQARAYTLGAYTVVYPVVRGTGPLITVLAAGVVFHEHFAPMQWFGVLVLVSGIFGLAVYNLVKIRVDRDILIHALILAFLTGIMVAAYTTYDAYGIRAAADPFTFLAWFFMIDGFFMPILVNRRLRALVPSERAGLALRGISGAFVAFFSFGAIMLATRLDKVGEAAVLRETSTLFAAVIGVVFLKETVGPRRVFLMGLIALGAVLVEFGS
ncbi:MAG: EamA family transporter [Rhodobacteraceae bacterium]|nr:EamA family transporter [Paracoccaceae bacterium]